MTHFFCSETLFYLKKFFEIVQLNSIYFIYLLICLFIYLFLYLVIYLFIYLFLYLWFSSLLRHIRFVINARKFTSTFYNFFIPLKNNFCLPMLFFYFYTLRTFDVLPILTIRTCLTNK